MKVVEEPESFHTEGEKLQHRYKHYQATMWDLTSDKKPAAPKAVLPASIPPTPPNKPVSVKTSLRSNFVDGIEEIRTDFQPGMLCDNRAYRQD